MRIGFSGKTSDVIGALSSLVCMDDGGKEETSMVHPLLRLGVRLRNLRMLV